MRRLLVDYARARKREKRGGQLVRVDIEHVDRGEAAHFVDLLEIDELLTQAGGTPTRGWRSVVELRFFGGLTNAETGEALGITERTVKRDWQVARAWLYSQLRRDDGRMAPDDWERIKQIFSAALGVPADAREAYVSGRLRRNARPCATPSPSCSPPTPRRRARSSSPAACSFDAPWLFRAGDRVAGRFDRQSRDRARRDGRSLRGVRRPPAAARRAQGPAAAAGRRRRRRRSGSAARSSSRATSRTRASAAIFDLIEHPVRAGAALPERTVIPCLTMQLLEGQSLEDYLRVHRPLRHGRRVSAAAARSRMRSTSCTTTASSIAT